MYSGYTTTAVALRAKSSFSYAPLPFFTDRADHCRGDCSSCAQSSLHGFSINPRFLLYGYCSRQSSLIYWSPSRSLFASRAAARCRRSALRELGLGPQCRRTSFWSRTSDGSFWEMIGLLAEARSCYQESYSAEESRNEAICDKVVSLGKNLKREVEIESVDGESRRSSRARKDGSSSVYYSESALDWCSGSERKERKGRRVGGESSRNHGSGTMDVGERVVRQVRKEEDNAGLKKRYVSEYDAGWDSSRKTEFREKDGNSRASSSRKLSEREIRDREGKAASLRSSRRGAREEHGYEEQNNATQEESWRFTRMSRVGENDARTGLSSKNVAGARRVDREEGSGSAGNWQGKVDTRVVGRTGWKVGDREERGAVWMDSAHEVREECDYKGENVYGERELREGSQRIARTRTSEVHGDDSKRFSGFQSTVDAGKVDREEGSAARRHSEIDQRVVGRAEWRFGDREEKGSSSIDLAHEAREEYGYEDEWVVRQRESREGSRKVAGTSDVYEDDTMRSSSSKNMVDARKVGWEVSSTSNKHTELDLGVVGHTELSSQKIRKITQARDSSTEGAANTQRHYEQIRVRDGEDRSASAKSLVHVSRDKRSQMGQLVLGKMESKKHNESRADVSRVSAGDAERASSSQRLLETRKDDREDYLASGLNLDGEARNQRNLINEQFTQQSSSRRTNERNTQNFEVSRWDAERAYNTQEIYTTKIESESVNRQCSSRRESEKETNISEYSRNGNETASSSQEISNMSIENRRGNASLTLVRDKMGKQRSTLTGDSSQPTKGQVGSFDSGTSSLNTYTHELDDQTRRREMYIIKDGSLESASQSDKSSALYIGEFVDKVQQEITTLDGLDYASKYSPGIQIEEVPSGTSNATAGTHSRLPAAASEDKDERYVEEGSRRSTSRSGIKGPSDEMWDVRAMTSQETSRTEKPEEDPTAAEAVDSTTATAGTENVVARRSHGSLWSYVADIIRLSWGLRAESRNPAMKSGTRSSSNESVTSEAWFSGQEPDDDDEIDEKGRSGTPKEPLLIKRPVDESYPRMHAGPSQGSSEVPKLEDTVVKSEVGTSTSMGITKTGLLAKGSSTVSRPEEVGWTEGEKGREGTPNVITVDQSSALTDDIAPAIIEEDKTNIGNVQLPVSKYTRLEEKLVEEGSTEVGKPDGKDGELKRRKLQRNKQVLKERFDEWEEAYRLESEQRKTDVFFMREALVEARKAADTWEVPVGAVLVQNGKIIARGCNLVEQLRDSTAHAEMICIREASNLLQTWRLANWPPEDENCITGLGACDHGFFLKSRLLAYTKEAETTLYVTLEPCPMCAGAILQARIDTVVWGAPNKLIGADGSWVRLFPGDGGSSSLDSSNQTVGPVHPFHPKIAIRRGVLATECSEVMQQFFQLRRKKNKKPEPSPPSSLPVSTHPTKFFTKIHDLFSVMFCL